MATETVAHPLSMSKAHLGGSTHDLWVGNSKVLTVGLDRNVTSFPPRLEHLEDLNEMIQGLSRASKLVASQLDHDEDDPAFLLGPMEAIANAIQLLSQLSSAVTQELRRPEASSQA